MRPTTNRAAMAQEALTRAQSGSSTANDIAVIRGFAARGIAETDIKPRENCLTYHAWRALGRQVRRGEHGVKVTTWIDKTETVTDPTTGQTTEDHYKTPWTATVFHISQTDPARSYPLKQAIRQLEGRI